MKDGLKDIQDIVRHGRHIHVANSDPDYYPDGCKICGHDIRHPIHLRVDDEDKEYEGYDVKGVFAAHVKEHEGAIAEIICSKCEEQTSRLGTCAEESRLPCPHIEKITKLLTEGE